MLLLLCYPFRYELLYTFLIPQGAVQKLYHSILDPRWPPLPAPISDYSETFAHKKNN